jgi:hypothetical protein
MLQSLLIDGSPCGKLLCIAEKIIHLWFWQAMGASALVANASLGACWTR